MAGRQRRELRVDAGLGLTGWQSLPSMVFAYGKEINRDDPPMASTIVRLDLQEIEDWESFHDLFAEVMGFPEFYGRNMSAWIDCMTSLDEPGDGLTSVHAPKDGFLVLHMDNAGTLAERHPELYAALVESAAFVNHRRIAVGEPPVLALSFWRRKPGTPS